MSKRLYFTITIDDKVKESKMRDIILDQLKEFKLIQHVSATFGFLRTNTVARDFKHERIYDGLAEEVIARGIKENELKRRERELQKELIQVREALIK